MTGGISDATLRGFTGYTMKRAFNEIQGDVNTALAPHGLRMLSFSALSIIADNPGLRQSQIAEALSIERANLVIVVDELERAGLIRRDPAPADRRAYALRLTAKGRKVHAQAIASVTEHEARMTAELTAEERTALLAALEKIENAKAGGGDNG